MSFESLFIATLVVLALIYRAGFFLSNCSEREDREWNAFWRRMADIGEDDPRRRPMLLHFMKERRERQRQRWDRGYLCMQALFAIIPLLMYLMALATAMRF